MAARVEREAFELFNLEEEPLPQRASPEFKADMHRRRLYRAEFHLDANLINASLKDAAANRLERRRDDGVIGLAMASVAPSEAQAGAGGKVDARKRKAPGHIFTIKVDGTPHEDATYARVEDKHNTILVTNDGESKPQLGGIIGHRG